MVSVSMKGWSFPSCRSECNHWFRRYFARYEDCVKKHHWKILLAGLAVLGLCSLGFKSMDFEKDLIKLWIYNSSRLHNETSYILKHSSGHIDQGSIETILQVTKQNILSPEYLLEHLQLLKLIVNTTVRYNKRLFTIQDLCRQIHLPRMHHLEDSTRTDVENMMPCEIVSPLHCFWEGSKLLNRDYRINTYESDQYHSTRIDWTSFDFLVFLKTFQGSWYKEFFEKLLNETGIGRGYITKPCIDVSDPKCPNKHRKPHNFENILKDGCYEIAANLYNYPKAVLVGKQNHAIQSLIFLRSAADVFQTMRSKEIDWSEEEVRKVIALWQSKVRQITIKYNKQRPYLESFKYMNIPFQTKRVDRSSFYIFTNNSLSIALAETQADETMLTKYLVVGGLVTLFAVIMFLWSDDLVRSHCWLAIVGTFLVITAMIGGLGFSAAIGMKFTVLTMQVIPFLMLGLGVDDVFIFTTSYSRIMDADHDVQDMFLSPVYQTLYNCATVIILTFLIKMSILAGIIFIPVPLMKNFCGQILVVTIFQTGTVVFLYPCLLYLDSLRQQSNRVDVFCCLLRRSMVSRTSLEDVSLPTYDRSPTSSSRSEILSSQVIFSTEFTTSPDDLVPNNIRQYVKINPASSVSSTHSPKPGREGLKPHVREGPKPLGREGPRSLGSEGPKPPEVGRVCRDQRSQCCWKLRYRLSRSLLHIIAIVPVHIAIILLTLAIVALGLYSAINVHCGLNLESIFLQDSNEYNYVKYESSEFRMNNFDVVTTEVDYVGSQDSLLQLNDEIKAVTNVEVFGNGKFWLSSLMLWLETLQHDFDRDLNHKFIFRNGTWISNASENGLLAMTLLVQDHGSINYKKLLNTRLVQSQKIDHDNFYLYLNVWRSVSADYDSIPCILYPEAQIFKVDNFTPNPQRMKPAVIRMSGKNLYIDNPLQFVSCKYFHRGVGEKEDLSFVKTIRSITSKFSQSGLTSMPLGNVFSLSEQYLFLRSQLIMAAIISLVCVFLVSVLTMHHLLVAVLICLLLTSSLLSPFLFINLYQLPLNGTSGIMTILSGALGIRLSLFVIISYTDNSGFDSTDVATGIGSGLGAALTDESDIREKSAFYSTILVSKQSQLRMRRALNSSPCGSVLISSLLCWVFIYMSNVSYIWENFLLLPLIAVIHSIFNCYFLAPVLCFYMLPQSSISILSSARSPSRRCPRTSLKLSSQAPGHRYKVRSNPYKMESTLNSSPHAKLSTISEESSSIKSSSTSQQDPIPQASCSQSQEYPQYIEQNVESSLTVQYPGSTPRGHNSLAQELALKTSFKYRKPTNITN